MDKLPQPERDVIRLRFGLAGTDPMMTSQVVRALERKGLLVRRRDPEREEGGNLDASDYRN